MIAWQLDVLFRARKAHERKYGVFISAVVKRSAHLGVCKGFLLRRRELCGT